MKIIGNKNFYSQLNILKKKFFFKKQIKKNLPEFYDNFIINKFYGLINKFTEFDSSIKKGLDNNDLIQKTIDGCCKRFVNLGISDLLKKDKSIDQNQIIFQNYNDETKLFNSSKCSLFLKTFKFSSFKADSIKSIKHTFKNNNNFNKISKFDLCVIREKDGINKKSIEKIKQKFNPDKHNSKLLLVEKNILSTLDINISPEIKKELDNSLKITSEIEKEEKPLVSKVDAYYFMKSIDSKFESFFHNREFNLKNFNYYMQVLSSQGKTIEMEEMLIKMQEMGINPSTSTFIILMNSYAKAKNIEECERVFSIINKRTKNKTNIFVYNTLLLAYAKNGLVNQAQSIINEMIRKGLNPDTACYTTLIHAYRKVGDYGKCWDLYEDCKLSGNVDEFLISYMIKLAGFTKNPEKALLLYEYFELEGFNHYTINFNSLLFALSSTKKYAEQALEVFKKMKMKNVAPDSYTYVYVLRATSHLGDINTANEIIKEIKLMNIPINEYICNGLIRTFAGAAKIPYVKTEHLEEYLKDSWNILQFMEKNNIKISVHILDSLLEVHCSMHKMEDVDGLVLPLYEKYGFEFTLNTYEKLCQMLFDLRKFDRVIKIYEALLKKSEEKNYYQLSDRILNYIMETGIKTNDCDLIVSSLKNFRNINAQPKRHLLRTLASLDNLPDSLFVELRKWIDTDKLSRKFRAFSPPQIRERDRTPTPVQRKRGKRIK